MMHRCVMFLKVNLMEFRERFWNLEQPHRLMYDVIWSHVAWLPVSVIFLALQRTRELLGHHKNRKSACLLERAEKSRRSSSRCATKTAVRRRGVDSTRPLTVRCGIWHRDVSSRSCKSCKLWGGVSVDRTRLSRTSHGRRVGLRSGESGGRVNTSNSVVFLKPFLNSFCSVWGSVILLREDTDIREHRHHEGVNSVWSSV